MPIEAYRQKNLKAGKIVVPPIAKATMSVKEVMVIATPACWKKNDIYKMIILKIRELEGDNLASF